MKKLSSLSCALAALMAFAACSTTQNTATTQEVAGSTKPEAAQDFAWLEMDTGRQPASNCDSVKFAANIRKKCYLSNNDERRIDKNASYCKVYQAKKKTFNVVTMRASGDVVVFDQQDCSRVKYEVDSSGIDEMKITGGFAYMRSADGQLYIVDAKGVIYEIRSNSGNSYSKAMGSAVTDIAGGNSGSSVIIKLQNGQTFDLTPDDVVNNPNRFRKVNFYYVGSQGSVYND